LTAPNLFFVLGRLTVIKYYPETIAPTASFLPHAQPQATGTSPAAGRELLGCGGRPRYGIKTKSIATSQRTR
jgi:hypothetical protein